MSMATNPEQPGLGLLLIWSSEQAVRERLLEHARTLVDVRRVQAVRWTPALVEANCARLTRLRAPAGGGDPGPVLVVTTLTGPGGSRPAPDPVAELRNRAGTAAQVHASLSRPAAARDLMLLLGSDPATHLASCPGPWDGRVDPRLVDQGRRSVLHRAMVAETDVDDDQGTALAARDEMTALDRAERDGEFRGDGEG